PSPILFRSWQPRLQHPHPMETDESSIDEPEPKRSKMEEDSVAPVPQPVIVAMNQEASE
ncbi:hypothetical protein M9458_005779, partial [Cirrhinus mrigala]